MALFSLSTVQHGERCVCVAAVHHGGHPAPRAAARPGRVLHPAHGALLGPRRRARLARLHLLLDGALRRERPLAAAARRTVTPSCRARLAQRRRVDRLAVAVASAWRVCVHWVRMRACVRLCSLAAHARMMLSFSMQYSTTRLGDYKHSAAFTRRSLRCSTIITRRCRCC